MKPIESQQEEAPLLTSRWECRKSKRMREYNNQLKLSIEGLL